MSMLLHEDLLLQRAESSSQTSPDDRGSDMLGLIDHRHASLGLLMQTTERLTFGMCQFEQQ